MLSLIKDNNTPLLIAEIGGNHEGDFNYAKELTRLAIDSGADAVKFQIYTGDTLVSKKENPQRNKHFKTFELSPEQHIELAKMVLDAGKLYSSSVWDIEALEWIDPYVSFYKIGSGDLTAYPVLKAIASKNKPMVLSTGLSSENEVVECVKYLQKLNSIYKKRSHLGVLQCTSMYPITQNDVHLNVMKHFEENYNWTSGYSDHTEGTHALEIAVAMGAKLLEFHFTDSRDGKSFRDHKVSLTRDEVLALKEKIKSIIAIQGQSSKQPLSIEIDNGHDLSFRRAVYPAKDISKGEILDDSNLTVLRPLAGIDARDYYQLIGRRLLCDVEKHQKLEWNYINKTETTQG